MDNSNIPVVFIHSGNQSYLYHVIKRAETCNKQVFLLGDETNKAFCENWFSISEFKPQEYSDFEKIYEHMSSNPYDFELACFKRFFILLDFAKKQKLSHLIMLDSDCLAFTDFSSIGLQNSDCALAIPKKQDNYFWAAFPHACYWTIDALEDFVKFMFYSYTDGIASLKEKYHYHTHGGNPGGICDMTVLYLWQKKVTEEKKFTVFNTLIENNNAVFDCQLPSSDNYLPNEFKRRNFCRMKTVKFENGIPYFFTKDRRKVQVLVIHCISYNKIYIKTLAKKKSGLLRCTFILLLQTPKRLRNKIKHLLKK